MNTAARNNSKIAAKTVLIEGLEARQMMAADPMALTTSTVSYNGGTQLVVNGTINNDSIGVSPVAGGVILTNGKWSATIKGAFNSVAVFGGQGNDLININAKATLPAFIHGGLGNDTLNGGAGNDKIYGDAGTDIINGNAGNDILVSIGGTTTDKTTGGLGDDSFWVDAAEVTDATLAEIKTGNVHKVTAFATYQTTSRGVVRTTRVGTDLNGENLADPIVSDASVKYKNFSANPLFSNAGPSADDVAQGYVGDCWFLSSLASVAKTNANVIRQSVVELGDGTYAVQFTNDYGVKTFVRVDGELPTTSWGGMEYADLGKQNSVWVAIMEKAYACFRTGGIANYANLDGGWMDEAFGNLGLTTFAKWSSKNADELLNWLSTELKAGKAVTLAIDTPANGAPVIGSHAYTVVSVDTDANGNRTVVLRNPWGVDGAGNDGSNDGYVRLTAAQTFGSTWGAISAKV